MSGSPADVILLRAGNEPDRYVQTFAEAGLRARCEPVLRFAFPHDVELRDRLRRRRRYAGIIVTSPRAARALRRVFDELGTLHSQWDGAPAYVVGPKTGERLRDLGFEVSGEETGNAAALVDLITKQELSRPLLFLSGNRRRDELPDGLRAEGVDFEEQVVYETHFRSDLTLPPATPARWIVFFSPSGLDAVRRAEAGPLTGHRCAAIGPTTAEALREQGLQVDVVAETPSPKGLVAAIVASYEA